MSTIAYSMTTSMMTYNCHSPVNMLNFARGLSLWVVVVVDETPNELDEKVDSTLYSVRTARKGRATVTATSSCSKD